jgi:hypothetical protein
VAALGALAAALAQATNGPITSVKDLGLGRVAVKFHVPTSQWVHAVRFVELDNHKSTIVSLDPAALHPAYRDTLERTPTEWIVAGGSVGLRRTTYAVYLLIARRAACTPWPDMRSTQAEICKGPLRQSAQARVRLR